MAKDPAFLFYPADASEDTQFMNRLERGCYFDILKAQKKFSRFSIDIIKKVLGKDFESCWPSIESVLKKDEIGYYIEWVDDAIEKRKSFTESRKQNRSRANNQELFIYLMKDYETGNYKIGSSINPERRLIELRKHFPKINLQYSFGKTAQTTEAELHKIFNEKQIFNEFYELLEEDVTNIIEHMTKHMNLHMTNHMVNEDVIENEIEVKKRKKKLESPPPPKDEIVYPFDSKHFLETWGLWMEYKKERKEKYTRIGEQAQLKKLSREANGDETLAINMINQALENNWQGIYPIKNNSNGTGNSKNGDANGLAELERELAAQFGFSTNQ